MVAYRVDVGNDAHVADILDSGIMVQKSADESRDTNLNWAPGTASRSKYPNGHAGFPVSDECWSSMA